MLKINNPVFLLLLGIILVFSITNCKKRESDIGLDVQPQNDRIPLYHTDTIQIYAYVVSEDSLTSYSNSLNLAGSYFDPVFGVASASFLTHYRLSTNNVVFDKTGDGSLTADSIVLYLDISEIYGHSSDILNLSVYKLNNDIYKDTAYYSDIDINNYCDLVNDLIGTKSFIPANFSDSTISITLNTNFAEEILFADTSNLTNNDAFLSMFKGLYVKSDDAVTSGTGNIVSFDLLSDNSKLILYYHDSQDDSLSYTFVINNNCARINAFSHDYSSSQIQPAIDNPAYQDSILYLQGLGGVKTKITFTNIDSWQKMAAENHVAITKAELIVPIETDDATASTYPKPERLTVRAIKDNGSQELIIDDPIYNQSYSYFNGYIDSVNNTYNMVITRYFQYLLQGEYSDHGLYIIPYNKRIEPNRVIIGNTNNSNKLKLVITYTKF